MKNDLWTMANMTAAVGNRYLYDNDDNLTAVMCMIDSAYKAGVRLFILTPVYEFTAGTEANERAITRANALCSQVSDKYPGFKICIGNRVKYHRGVINNIILGQAAPVCDSRYVPLVFNDKSNYSFLHNGVSECFAAGYRPILCNILECNSITRVEYVEDLIEEGAYIALEADYFTAHQTKNVKRIVETLLERDEVSFVYESDCINKIQNLYQAAAAISEKYGNEKAESAFYENYIKVANNEII